MLKESHKKGFVFESNDLGVQFAIGGLNQEDSLGDILNKRHLSAYLNYYCETSKEYWPTFFSVSGDIVTTDGSARNGAAQLINFEKTKSGTHISQGETLGGVQITLDFTQAVERGAINYEGVYQEGTVKQSAALSFVREFSC